MTKKPTRGGLRNPPGGRPPSPNSKKPFLVKLPAEVIDWLRQRKKNDPKFSMGGWIGATLRDAIHNRRSEYVAVCAMPDDPGYFALYGIEGDGPAAANREGERVAEAFDQRLLVVARWRHWPGSMGIGWLDELKKPYDESNESN